MKKRVVWFVWILLSVAMSSACGAADKPDELDLTLQEPGVPTETAAPSPEPERGQEVVAGTDVMSSTGENNDNLAIMSEEIEIISTGQGYRSYLAVPTAGGEYPGIILIHSFNGLEAGYHTLTDRLAGEGFVVLAVGWQTYERSPDDSTIRELLIDSVAYLRSRDDVDGERIGLTGFCAGGRYTMLFLPQIKDFIAGVAWYGFPYRGDTQPADLVDDLTSPMLIIHGTADSPSPIEGIYQYISALEQAGKRYELKVYEGEPHGFMLSDGELREDSVALDAYGEMVRFFGSWLQ